MIWFMLGTIGFALYYINFIAMVIALIIGIPLAIFLTVKVHDHRKNLSYTNTYTKIVLSDNAIKLLYEKLLRIYAC